MSESNSNSENQTKDNFNNDEFRTTEFNLFSDKNSVYYKWGLTAFTVIAISMIFYLAMIHFEGIVDKISDVFSILMPVIDGFIIAYLLSPIINKIEGFIYKKKKFDSKSKRRIRALLILFVILLFIFLIYKLFSMILPEITSNIISITDNSELYYENFDHYVDALYDKYPEYGKNIDDLWNKYSADVLSWLNTNLMPKVTDFLKGLTTGIFSAVKAMWNIIIGLIISIYLMYNKETYLGQIKKVMYAFLKKDRANVFIHNIRFTNKTFNGFIVGKIVDSFIIGVICYIASVLLDLPYPLLISIIIGTTNIIPFFGPFIGAVPCALLILLIEPKECLIFIIMIIVLQQLDGNIIGPKIIGESTGISGFWVIFAITFFGGLWGVMGMFIGVPVFAVIYAAIKAFTLAKLEVKGLDTSTSKYIEVDYIDDSNEFIATPRESVNNITSKKTLKKPNK